MTSTTSATTWVLRRGEAFKRTAKLLAELLRGVGGYERDVSRLFVELKAGSV